MCSQMFSLTIEMVHHLHFYCDRNDTFKKEKRLVFHFFYKENILSYSQNGLYALTFTW